MPRRVLAGSQGSTAGSLGYLPRLPAFLLAMHGRPIAFALALLPLSTSTLLVSRPLSEQEGDLSLGSLGASGLVAWLTWSGVGLGRRRLLSWSPVSPVVLAREAGSTDGPRIAVSGVRFPDGRSQPPPALGS